MTCWFSLFFASPKDTAAVVSSSSSSCVVVVVVAACLGNPGSQFLFNFQQTSGIPSRAGVRW